MKAGALAGLAGAALGCLAWAHPAGAAAPVCAPVGLIRMVTRNVTPGAKLSAFATKPLVTYRSGALLLRNEEADDPEQKLHLLMVLNAPDTWFVNLTDRTGKHIVDPGPDINVHAPIFSGPGVTKAFADLEFGCEAAFVADHMPKAEAAAQVDGVAVSVHRLRDGDELLELKMAKDRRPVEAAYYKADKPLMVIRYDRYDRGLPADPALFSKPQGFTYAEERPGGGAR